MDFVNLHNLLMKESRVGECVGWGVRMRWMQQLRLAAPLSFSAELWTKMCVVLLIHFNLESALKLFKLI